MKDETLLLVILSVPLAVVLMGGGESKDPATSGFGFGLETNESYVKGGDHSFIGFAFVPRTIGDVCCSAHN